MNQVINIPKFFHELLGSHQTKSEVLTVALFTTLSTLILAWLSRDYWQSLTWYQNLFLWLLYIDISGGVVANLTAGTNTHYNNSAKARWTFIAIHIQPLLLAWILQSPMSIALFTWAYTIASAVAINSLRNSPYQRPLAGALLASALLIYVFSGITLQPIIAAIYLLYVFKVAYSFSVKH